METSPDWVAWVTAAGSLGTLVGVWLAFRQLQTANQQLDRTATASEETTKAVRRTQKQIVHSQILLLVPQMQLLERELDDAVTGDDRLKAQTTLRSWRDRASQLRAFLVSHDLRDDALFEQMDKSIDLANRAKGSLVEQSALGLETGEPLVAVTKRARSAIEAVVYKLTGIATELSVDNKREKEPRSDD